MHLDQRISVDHQATEAFGAPFDHSTRDYARRGSLRVTSISNANPTTEMQSSSADSERVADDACPAGTAELELTAGTVPKPLSAAQAKPSDSNRALDTAIEYLHDCYPHTWPALTLVLGSGLAEAVAELEVHAQVQYANVSGFRYRALLATLALYRSVIWRALQLRYCKAVSIITSMAGRTRWRYRSGRCVHSVAHIC